MFDHIKRVKLWTSMAYHVYNPSVQHQIGHDIYILQHAI